ncbi:MAG TPA: hypothetical protein VMX16_00895 [Terriglobia bacterium]|nr:hypothetical protein [Terriglobia bacterium]
MNRRKFLSLASSSLASQVFAKTEPSLRPETLDLRQPVQLGVQCMTHRMDPDERWRPWFAIDVKDWTPFRLRHDVWDFGDTGGRFLEAFIEARQMVVPNPQTLACEQKIRRFVNSLFGPDGVIGNPELKGPDHMFAQGSALYGLVTDYEDSRDPALQARIEHFIVSLDRMAVHEKDYLWFPQVATPIAPCSHMAAYQVLPVVRFYELTGYAPALRYAEQLSRWAFYYDPTVTPEGVIIKTGWEGHLHAWMDTFSGIIRCARAGGELDQVAVLERSRRLYEWVRANYCSRFGWVADSVGSKTCETDTITSAVRLALELIKAGHVAYWNDVERYVRNQLVENQFGEVSNLRIQNPVVARGLRGAFESYADPNRLIALKNGTIEGCCINGGIRGFFLAYEHALAENEEMIRVNLLVNCGNRNLEVASYMPFEGRIDLYPRTTKPLLVRLPDWLEPHAVKIDGHAGLQVEPGEANHLRIGVSRENARVTLRFNQPESRMETVVAGRSYRVRWRGDTVVDLGPAGQPYPIYQRASFRSDHAPMRNGCLPYRRPRISW